ncbi:MAG: alpha/beta hydrolase [Wenzhouxiangellaceae bacterium]
MLAVEHHGQPRHGRIVLSHGFGQTRHAWRDTAQALAADGWQATTYDARGHGESGRPDDGIYDVDDFVADFERLIEPLEAPPIVVGASLGGLVAMLSQARQPQVELRALVLVDITPRWERQGVNRMLGFMQAHAGGFPSLEAARQAVRDYLPHRQNAGGSLQRNLYQDDQGWWHWHWDPRMLEFARLDHEQHQRRLAHAAAQISVPTLLVSGGRSDMISSEHIDELLTLIPHAEHARVADATHMVAGDDNDRFQAAIRPFLQRFQQQPTAGGTSFSVSSVEA